MGKASHAFSSRLDYQEITDGESRSGGNELDSSRFTCFRPQHTTVANIQTPPVYTNTIRTQSEENTPANWLKIAFRDFYVVIVQL